MRKIKIFIVLMLSFVMIGSFVACNKIEGEDSEQIGIGEADFSEHLMIECGSITGLDVSSEIFEYIQEKFNVTLIFENFSFDNWASKFNGMVAAGRFMDAAEFDLRPEYRSLYQDYISGKLIKALPSNMSSFPNLKASLDEMPVLDYLKSDTDGKLYCIPLKHGYEWDNNGFAISDVRYMYRRDWAKELGVYKTGDIYTVAEFEAMMDAFKRKANNIVPFADIPWGLLSYSMNAVTQEGSFQKDPSTNKYGYTYTQSEFVSTLDTVRKWYKNGWYDKDFVTRKTDPLLTDYFGGRVGILYNNYTLSNLNSYAEIMQVANPSYTPAQMKDAMAPMHLRYTDNKITALGMENFWSATVFSYTLSNAKMERLLYIMDWMLSEEGLEYAAYGVKGVDWTKDEDGNIEILWEKDDQGKYLPRGYGARGIYWLTSTGTEVDLMNPAIPDHVKENYVEYRTQLNALKANGDLRIILPDRDVQWLSGMYKDSYSTLVLDASKTAASTYVTSNKEFSDTTNALTNCNKLYSPYINGILNEINTKLGL